MAARCASVALAYTNQLPLNPRL